MTASRPHKRINLSTRQVWSARELRQDRSSPIFPQRNIDTLRQPAYPHPNPVFAPRPAKLPTACKSSTRTPANSCRKPRLPASALSPERGMIGTMSDDISPADARAAHRAENPRGIKETSEKISLKTSISLQMFVRCGQCIVLQRIVEEPATIRRDDEPASSERVFGPAMAGHANAGALRVQAGSGCMQLFFNRRNTRDIRMTGRPLMASH